MLRVGWGCCPFCRRQDIYVSAPKYFWEELAILLLLQSVRCHDCMRRFFRPLLAAPPPKVRLRKITSVEAAQKEANVDKRAA